MCKIVTSDTNKNFDFQESDSKKDNNENCFVDIKSIIQKTDYASGKFYLFYVMRNGVMPKWSFYFLALEIHPQ